MIAAGMTALAVAFPPTIRTNAYWRERHPDLVRSAAEQALSKLWARPHRSSAFERAMAPYVQDPFKGARERRVLAAGESSVDLLAAAVANVLQAWDGELGDFDLAIVAAMRPDTIAVGDAAWLAQRVGLRCPAINLETACSSSVMAFDLACSLVETGRYRKILVVVSCTYSRDVDETNTLSWFLADGAAAFVVEARLHAAVPLASKQISTAATCGAFVHTMEVEGSAAKLRMQATPTAGTILHDTAEPYVRACCLGALDAAKLSPADIKLFVFNTPTAWYADFCADVLGVARSRAVSTYPIYTNVGPALMPVNLHHAAQAGRLTPGDAVLLYSVGSASTAMALVVAWGDVALGSAAPPPQSPDADGPAISTE